ncbi:hypothetical protein GBP04_06220 [Pediococcus acidilactici]|uniref:Ig-like domain-containing protein n=1 Tax=Pediococcus acidilactici TaxID=1254 RepID=UPI001327ED04|nr:Ig-like domain-containing protein [Pediococcus acidilactici]KAF0465369.1 hypothetical protein GBP04_06220 [Pediococcus acidilactici]
MNKNPKNHRDVVDSKIGNYKMYKVNKHWVFASALMLSMLGAGMMQTDAAAHADTVNEPQTEMVHKVAEAKETQSASVTPAKETTAAASSAAPSSAAPAKAAQSSTQNDSAAKTEKSATASSAASSAAPTKAASSATDKSATNAATKTDSATKAEQKKADASNSAAKAEQKNDASANKNEQKTAKADSAASSSAAKPAADTKAQTNNSSAAKPADNSSASNSDASVKKEGVSTDEIGASGLDTNDQNDINNDAAAKAKADVDAQANDKNTVDNKKVDKNKTAKDRDPRAGGSALENGNLTISGSAVNGLIDNGDGTYSGNLTFNYNGSAWVAQFLEGSKIALQIPPQLRDLFAKINASGNWSKYFSGSGEFYSHLGLIPISYQDWTYENSDFSYDGTNLTLKNPVAGIELVTKDTTVTLNFDIGQAVTDFHEKIDNAGDNYTFTEALIEESDIIDWHIIGDYAGVASLNTSHLMPAQDELNPPTVNQPVYDNTTTLTGTGEPNAEIIITLPTGGTLSTHTNENGDFSIAIPAQPAGSEISVSQKVNGQTSEVIKVPVEKAPEVIDKPGIDAPHAGSKYVTGTGVAGDTIQVYMPGVGGGEDVLIGTTTVGLDGKWVAQVSSQYNLVEGETIYAVQIKGNAKSDKQYTTVIEEIHVDAPVINPIEEGDTVITGTGEAGDEVTVYFDDGTNNVIGHATVQADGTWTVDAGHTRLVDGDVISAIQIRDGVTSEKDTVSVKAKEVVDAPVIHDVTEGDQYITGTGEAGDTITVYFEDDGSQIGQPVVVASDGTWRVSVGHVTLTAGARIYAIQSKGDVNSERAYTTVKAKEEVSAPVINDITEGDSVITGTGIPGATVNVSFADGSPIGVGVKVDANGNWTVDASHVTLKGGDQIVATQTVNGVTSDQGKQTVKAKEEVSAPVINDITEGDRVITGTGTPGATVNVSFADGSPIGVGVKVDANGNWTVDASHVTLKAGDQIVATQTVNGVTSDQGKQTVKAKEEVSAPVINDITEGDSVITGTGTPGATVNVSFADGSPIGVGVKVDANGNWTVDASHVTLKAGDQIVATQTVNGVTSDQGKQTVKAKEEVSAPVINDITEGDSVITGTGTPGATVNVSFADGSPIGVGVKVDANGNWTVDASHVTLKAGDQIVATQTVNGVTSDQGTQTVKAKEEVSAPVINDITEGDRVITGTGTPGATVNVSFADGSPIGVGVKVDANGNWTVDASHVTLKAGDQIVATQTVNGVTSDQGKQTVKAKEEVSAPVINDITEGDRVITGTGTPGATVNVSFADGSPIGIGVKVDANGNWTVDASHVTLKAGDQIVATQTVNGVTSDQGKQTVKAKEEVSAPVINDITEGDRVITGTGTPGATVNVSFADGSPIGIGVKVDANGNWTVDASHVTLKAGDQIVATQTVNGVTSDQGTQTVKAKEEVSAPVINDITEGASEITGTGTPGATVNVSFADGTPIGVSVKVDANGNWTVDASHVTLKAGDQIVATQTVNGVTSDQGTQTVKPKQGTEVPQPNVDAIKAGSSTITGKGEKGDQITATLKKADGSTVPLGTVSVDPFGKWTITLPEGVVLAAGDVVTVVQIASDGSKSDPLDVPVN